MNSDYIKGLNEFLFSLDIVYGINSGACALIAYLISKWCLEHNIEYKTKLYSDEDDHIWHFSLIVNNEEINPSTCEAEKCTIEDDWTPEMLKDRYEWILDEHNFWRRKNEKTVMKMVENFLYSN